MLRPLGAAASAHLPFVLVALTLVFLADYSKYLALCVDAPDVTFELRLLSLRVPPIGSRVRRDDNFASLDSDVLLGPAAPSGVSLIDARPVAQEDALGLREAVVRSTLGVILGLVLKHATSIAFKALKLIKRLLEYLLDALLVSLFCIVTMAAMLFAYFAQSLIVRPIAFIAARFRNQRQQPKMTTLLTQPQVPTQQTSKLRPKLARTFYFDNETGCWCFESEGIVFV